MKTLIVILLMASSVYAQTLVEAARKEQERRAHLRPAQVFKAEGPPASEPLEQQKPQPQLASPPVSDVDPTRQWNEQIRETGARIQALQLEETATELEINELNSEVFAPVTDQVTKDQALAGLADARRRLTFL